MPEETANRLKISKFIAEKWPEAHPQLSIWFHNQRRLTIPNLFGIKDFMSQEHTPESPESAAKLQRIWNTAAIIVGLESLSVLGFLVNALLIGQFRSAAADLTLVALYAAASLWVGFTAWRLREGLRWARSSTIFWQTAQLYIASQSFVGRGSNWYIGGFLAITGLLVLALMFSKPVLRHAKNQVL